MGGHTGSYFDAVDAVTLDRAAEQALGVPSTAAGTIRARGSAMGSCQAAFLALAYGASGHFGGGTHHAFSDRPEGFCTFNDLAIASRLLLAAGELARDGQPFPAPLAEGVSRGQPLPLESLAAIRRVLVVDLDVHQGNGTAVMLADEPRAFTMSAHCSANLFSKPEASDMDVELPPGTDDVGYMAAVGPALERAFEVVRPDVVLYQAGVDPLHSDALGRMSMTRQGLRQRNKLVFDLCREAGCPVSVYMGGGYSNPIEHTVNAHFDVFVQLLQHAGFDLSMPKA